MANDDVTGLFGTTFQPTFRGLLGDPVFNVGLGLLAAGLSKPKNLGTALAQGLQTAGSLQEKREEISRERKERQAKERLAAGIKAAAAAREGRGQTAALPGTAAGAAAQPEPLLGLLAEFDPAAAIGLLSPPEPTTLQRNFEFLTGLGFTDEQALQALQSGTTVNVGDQGKPLSISDLSKLRLPDGSTPPIGTTPSDALQMGARILTTDQQKALAAAEKFTSILDQLEELALGKGGVFTNIAPGFSNRVKAGLDLFIGSITRDRPNIEAYESLAQGTIAPFVRQLGESGALSEGDVERALALLPQVHDEFLLPDTREDAINKLNALREILEGGLTKLHDQTTGRSSSASRGGSKATGRGRVIDFNDLPE